MRERKYSVVERIVHRDGKRIVLLYAKTSYTGTDGKRHTLWRSGRTKTDARDRCRRDLETILRQQSIGATRARTFAHLAKVFRERYLVEAEYVDGRKVRGMRSYQTSLFHLKPLELFFANKRLETINYNDLEDYRSLRLKTPTQGKSSATRRQRKIASVNREMALLRRMLNKAVQMRWLDRSAFDDGETLVSIADETPRTRVLSREEEIRLMANAKPQLRGILICALDTAMRFGEITKLCWRDIDLFAEVIHVVGLNTKTLRPRVVPISKRLRIEFLRLSTKHLPSRSDLVFGITSNVRRSFKTTCQKADIRDFRIHDCRATAITRWIEGGIPDSLAGQLAGQSQPRTTWRYTRSSAATLKQAVEILDQAATLADTVCSS